MTNILREGIAFGHKFELIAYNGEVQLYWDDGEYSAYACNWQTPQEIADEWFEELMEESENRGYENA